MNKGLRTRTIIIAAVVLLAAYGVVGLPRSIADLKANLQNNIRLGLDLKGGSRLVLQVQIQDALKAEAARTIEGLKEELNKQNIAYGAIDSNDPSTVEQADSIQVNIHNIPVASTSDFRNLVNDKFPSWVLTPESSADYRMTFKPTELIAIKRETMERTIQTIDKRINALGLTEPTIQQRGRAEADYEILVELPGIDDPARVKQIMQTAAMLEISEVKDGPFPSPEAAMAKHGGVLPLDSKLYKETPRPGQQGESWYLLNRTPVITGRDLRSARPSRDEMQAWETAFTLNKEGARRFGTFTGENVGNKLAVILDNQIRSVATIQSRIEDSGVINHIGSEQDAADLSMVLQSGSLPAGIVYEEERTVGPSLGADSIRAGLTAGAYGLAAVILAMLIYYRHAGVNAVLALILNALILLAALGYFGAVLTLPGIAGFILTIGMAVDSNVLIFERIREELRAGKGIVAAVDTGFNKAFLTIIDTHVTTVVSCAFLFMFGTGPVKGFAVTLVIGLIANVFTAVFVSRTMFEWTLSRQRQLTTLSI
jgi:preprotein translocase subunit SecD